MNRVAPQLAFLAVTITAATACNHAASNYCKDVPVTHNCMDDADTGCTSNTQCSAPTPVCDVDGAKTCVQCTGSDETACTGATPVCGANNMCEACTMHAQCGSKACLPDGSCGTDSNVAYVDPSGTDNTMCTKAMPCTKVASALATSRPFVKFHGTTDEAVTVTDKTVTFLADPASKLTRTTNGNILVIDGTSTVAIFDLEISGASGTGFGISMPSGAAQQVSLTRAKLSSNVGGGISASGGTLIVTQSTISGNPGGGISLSNAAFTLTNNFIVQNGSPTSLIGGIDFASIPGTGAHQLSFNTVAANTGTSSVNGGVNCGTVGAPTVFSDNIIYGNPVSGGGKQIGGSTNCSSTYSDIGPDTSPGTGNLNSDPLFVNPAQGNFHIQPNSPCKDAADPAATLDVDVDGDTRPQGSGRDIGADEVP